MSKNKIRHTAPPSKSSLIVKTLFGAVLVGGVIWGLVALFEPPANLVPYTKFKKTDVSATQSTEEPTTQSQPEPAAPVDTDTKKAPQTTHDPVSPTDPDRNALDFTKLVSNDPVAPPPNSSNLPRETLEYISKGMGLVEKGKYERAELEFEKAADRKSVV